MASRKGSRGKNYGKWKGCGNKRRYHSRGEANKAAVSQRRQGKGETRPYRCPNCSGWHLTSKGVHAYKSKQRRARARRKGGS